MIYKVSADHFFLETDGQDRLALLKAKLKAYILRRKIDISERDDLAVISSLDSLIGKCAHCFADPRDPSMGFRALVAIATLDQFILEPDISSYTQRRLERLIPEGAYDMQPEKAIPLEYNLDELNAFDWEKGCYMGQELMARTKHRGLIRKRLMRIQSDREQLLSRSTKVFAGEKEIGIITSTYGSQGFALIRVEEYKSAHEDNLRICDEAQTRLTIHPPTWACLDL
jgi:folate-binding protein YgfZ